MTVSAHPIKQYFADLKSRGEDIDRPLLWTFYLREVAAGDMKRLKTELQKSGYRVDICTTLAESFPSKVDAGMIQRHTVDSIAQAWDYFESIAQRYSCSLAGVGFAPAPKDAI